MRISSRRPGFDHELLKAFHAGLRHFSRSVTIVELRQTRGTDSFEALLQELVVTDLGIRVRRKLADRLVPLSLDFRLCDEREEFAGIFLVLRIRRNEECVGRCFFGARRCPG